MYQGGASVPGEGAGVDIYRVRVIGDLEERGGVPGREVRTKKLLSGWVILHLAVP